MTEQDPLPYDDDEKFELLLTILKRITNMDDDLNLAMLADLMDENEFIWMDEVGRVKPLSQDGKSQVYNSLKYHQRMLAHKEYDFPGSDYNQWLKYQSDLDSLDYCLDSDGQINLALRVWINKKHINQNKIQKQSESIITKRVELIQAWVEKNGVNELHKLSKLDSWNKIFTAINPVLFPPVTVLGANCRVSKTFSAAGVIFKSGRPSKR
ncbi:MAG: hypothetical protein HRT92_03150 [Piscirickettsiaceae bacterium]|nr:hypothetical protein [Piscirickettsiaceae bacterium]